MAIGNEFDLTSTQAITLLLIDEGQPRPMKNFCLLFHCDASNITGIVDGLEKKGLVSRQNDPSDRRIKVIRLEPAGKRMQQAIIEQLETANDFMLGNLTSVEQQQFITIVQKLATTN
jgi:DNA-binding MarR family transcriptional regulator